MVLLTSRRSVGGVMIAAGCDDTTTSYTPALNFPYNAVIGCRVVVVDGGDLLLV